MAVREESDPELYRELHQKNLLRQYDLLTNLVEVGLTKGIEAFDKYTLWALNHVAVSGLVQFAGRWRNQPVYVGKHIPPHFEKVGDLMDEFISVVHENWDSIKHPLTLPAYALWRLNWIHPFIDGNGRTARAACYYLICMRTGRLLGGEPTVPELIRHNRLDYEASLTAADRQWHNGHFDVSKAEMFLDDLVSQQLESERQQNSR